ncbi:conserved hypothetical protein [Burkholderiales bacterium 8X]|nr:conserved hypothetical protein [Burkholderiales bacterium 8X]
MSLDADRLYELLPAIHRIRDGEQGGPLRALLAAFAEEFAALEDNIEQLYDDQFIETCADWVAPYIGDLVGYRPLHGLGGAAGPGLAPAVASPRAEVANTIRLRRRKGTALMLEQLAGDVTGWPAHAVEFFEQLATTQYMKHPRLHAPATADLRRTRALFEQGGPFNALAHTAEMRRPETGAGRYNIPNIGIFLWRLRAFRLGSVPLTPDPTDASGRRFRLNPLGADLQLFRRARTEDDITHLAEPINLPAPLSVRLMALAVRSAQAASPPAPDARLDDDYGEGESLVFLRPGNAGGPPTPVPLAAVRVCDLRDRLDAGGNPIGWNHEDALPAGTIGFDPERGRVLLGDVADGPLLASFHLGAASAIGGGEYERSPEGADLPAQRAIRDGASLQPMLDQMSGGGRLLIGDSLRYEGTPAPRFEVDAPSDDASPGIALVVAARNGARPLIEATGEIALAIGRRGRLVLDGLVISGAVLRLAAPAAGDDAPCELVLRDCTLVPGISLLPDGSAASPGTPSLIVEHPFASITLERCITGPLQIVRGAEVALVDCILDAVDASNVAFDGDGAGGPGGMLTLRECTVVGKLHTRRLELASNSLLVAALGPSATETWRAPVIAERRQQGCVRFSYLPAGAITPRRFRCMPDAGHLDAAPHFSSLRYGAPGYGQLRQVTSKAIREGADDGGEMGVLHGLFQPQRENNLRIRLDEYLRFGLRAGFFHAN